MSATREGALMNLWEAKDEDVLEDIKRRWESGSLDPEHVLWLLRATQRYRMMLDRVVHASGRVLATLRQDELDVVGSYDLMLQVQGAGHVLAGEVSREVDQQLGVLP